MKVLIEKLDHKGQGIAYVDGVITFVPKTIVNDEVEIRLVKKTKKYNLGEVVKYIKRADNCKKAFCPYYDFCGGCHLQNLSYEETLEYKAQKVKEIFKRLNLEIKPIVVKNPEDKYYRNKIELKVVDKKVGFFESKSNKLIEIDECFITKEAINRVIGFIKNWGISNGEIVLRCNKNEEILIWIKTKDEVKIDVDNLKEKVKLVGIVLNNDIIYGDDFYIERMNNLLFKVSYDSFFQVNTLVSSLLFDMVCEVIDDKSSVLDLYCGVGTFSLNAARKCRSVLGIEIVHNAVLNALFNAKINKLDNVKFVLNDVEDVISKVNEDFDLWIIDPPRSGCDKKTLQVIKERLPKKIFYVSCDPQTLVRDLSELLGIYKLEKLYIFDMFSYTYHVECVCVLNRG